jgi:2-oxoisovalerate dehydrogenase E1 component alpha subunit
VATLRRTDWMVPSFRETAAMLWRGWTMEKVLLFFAGYLEGGQPAPDQRDLPICIPVGTQLPHAVGLAYAAQYRGDDVVVMVYCGDGATSEGDFHEAMNFAAVFHAPVVFFVQNNEYAISVPLARQSVAPSLAHKGVGYGVPGERVDGNDAAALLSVLGAAVARARAGEGPQLVEAHTYRMQAHTNADDATRYRQDAEVAAWVERDPIARLEAYLRAQGLLDDAAVAAYAEEAERLAAHTREGLNVDVEPDPEDLFRHVYAVPTPQLAEQAAQVRDELSREGDLR